MIRDRLLSPLENKSFLLCEFYLEGKMTKRIFSTKAIHATIPLEFIHTYVYGPINVQAQSGYEYFIIFIDNYAIYGYVYLMH